MNTDAKIKNFTLSYSVFAKKAGSRYHLNPLVILAQAAVESGWGSSANARLANNFFGMLYTRSWTGPKRRAASGLLFRKYAAVLDSFMDFARLISSKYLDAAAVSFSADAYARAIAQSPYISEKNGDDRESYERNIRLAAKKIAQCLNPS